MEKTFEPERFEKERAEHFLDLLEPYLHHLTVCTMQQDWSEAEGAMSDTPESERDESWQLAYDEMRRKQNTCSCGLGDTIKLIAKISLRPVPKPEVSKEEIIEAIEAEPELPGEMPDEIWLASQDKESLAELLRITVRETKKGIKNRISELINK